MTKPDLMAELAEVVREMGFDRPQCYARDQAYNFLRAHRAELEAAVREAARYDYLSRRVYVEDHDGGWSSSYKLLPIPRHDGSTYKDAKPYNFATLDDAIDHAMHNSAREG